ncbi:MAG: ACT domain-containing protein [Gammaproteobacteria bacterium]|nr:ACT domain-containing protein [Gammaproteobacteria bacterium]
MSGEKNLKKLLSSISPVLMDGEYVFCSFEDAQYGDHADLHPVAAISEGEGLTLVVPKLIADQQGLHYESVFVGITLTVHSSLDAVGLTAAFSTRLSNRGISANVIAGFFHDHIFVQKKLAGKAIAALKELGHG